VLGKWKPGQRRLPGVEVHVSDSCTGCGVCVDACVYGLIQLEDGKAITDPRCIACGRCANTCPEDAVEVRVSDHKYIEKAIEILSRSVDVT
jgi:ferredoxin